MAECPAGHPNPAGWEFCSECGAPIDAAADEVERRYWIRTRWALVGIATLVVICGAVAIASVGYERRSGTVMPPPSGETAFEDWVSVAGSHVKELETVLDDTQRALESFDRRGLQTACEDLHEVSAVDLPAHLPTPDPDLTSELRASIDDAHAAAHMCLAAMAGSVNSYDGEFVSLVEEAARNVAAAQLRIRRALHRSQ
ncbi:zinc ribbon domain-containing protein [Mycolicibacterium hippocampi]|uniref:Uncharacterized protein n=1 Tax=Mycolicibacterium hippocampi TaxID=659824 RepID=A0A7I9ZGZ9_9MYCO|nr:zinc ribbon domain-containing protein [Mycolicibacterium hippocampi]GFH00285.1 hypothetical protein MHIP_07680 [Mycolicibacterium hippocampi]